MRIEVLVATLFELGLVGLASATVKLPPNIPHRPILPRPDDSQGLGTLGLFDQLVDHANPSLGTFKQRYWWNTDYYGGPGQPIVLDAPAESQVEPDYIDLSNRTMAGLLAQTNHGATITLEHRYWGDSSPVGYNFTAENLQHLTLDNAIQDLVYFAKNVNLPFDKNGLSKPSEAPWILSGCSYSGALSAWTEALAPGTFWAYQAGSAVVEAVSDFWEYFSPIEAALPRNCSADWKGIVSHVDTLLADGTNAEKAAFKESWYYPANTTDLEFAESFWTWLYSWQGHQLFSGYTRFFAVCDYIENRWPGSNTTNPGPEGVGLQLAIDGFARYRNYTTSLVTVPSNDTGVSDPWDEGDEYLWPWFLCNEPFEWWQDWGPGDNNGLLPKIYDITVSRKENCEDIFPDVNGFQYGLKSGATTNKVNVKTGGWTRANTTRVLWMGGEFDPWRPATVAWEGRPGGALQSTKEAPVYVIPGVAHCSDHYTKNGLVNEAAGKIFANVVTDFQDWVDEFYADRKARTGKDRPPIKRSCRSIKGQVSKA